MLVISVLEVKDGQQSEFFHFSDYDRVKAVLGMMRLVDKDLHRAMNEREKRVRVNARALKYEGPSGPEGIRHDGVAASAR